MLFQMKMTEIYDVTDADTEAVQSPTERDLNKQLEFDNDWSSDLIANEGEYMFCLFLSYCIFYFISQSVFLSFSS